MPFTLDPAVATALGALMGPNPLPPLPVGYIQGRRAQVNALISGIMEALPKVTDVVSQDFTTPASDGHALTLR